MQVTNTITVNEDGQLVITTIIGDQAPHAQPASRADSRTVATAILTAQGREGLEEAERIVAALKAKL